MTNFQVVGTLVIGIGIGIAGLAFGCDQRQKRKREQEQFRRAIADLEEHIDSFGQKLTDLSSRLGKANERERELREENLSLKERDTEARWYASDA